MNHPAGKNISVQPTDLESDHETNPNVLQRRASNPQSSVWVSASAGSGKTKVLTDRLLRLMLPKQDGTPGTLPHKILCLTFTKAGAGEMTLRIQSRVAHWATCSLGDHETEENSLRKDLKDLLGVAATPQQIKKARQLFTDIMETPDGLKIMTIHSFCQSVLGRFPLEADISPHFTLLSDSETKILQQKAQNHIFKRARDEKGSDLSEALAAIAAEQNEQDFQTSIKIFFSERHAVSQTLSRYFGVQGLYENLCQTWNCPAGQTPENVIQSALEDSSFDLKSLRSLIPVMAVAKTKGDPAHAIILQEFLDAPLSERLKLFDDYRSIFLKKDGEIKQKISSAETQRTLPQAEDTLKHEARRLYDLEDTLRAAHCARITRDFFLLGTAMLEEYERLKTEHNGLDYDDLILKTLALLEGRTQNLNNLSVAPWIRYKLDQGIDHLLVDEAQDTNPEQWGIIQALTDDFFEHQTQTPHRSLFVVGDMKQSIFSFQRAAPEKFLAMRDFFKKKILSPYAFETIDFNISFRSAPAILEAVDRTFAPQDMQKGVSEHPITHEAFYKKKRQAGQVVLWPLFESKEEEERDPWDPPLQPIERQSGQSMMAAHIADTIAGWINRGERLESTGAPIQAGDVMILVQSRNALIDGIIRKLKQNNIPVSGADRMVLQNQIVVEDLLAAIAFALLPEDNLTLAALLKSPFIGLTEDDLFSLCHGRQGTVWQSIKDSEDFTTVKDWLSHLIRAASGATPYDFIMHCLQSPCPAAQTGIQGLIARLGDDCLDPLNEFLSLALKEGYQENGKSLQEFLYEQQAAKTEIKRELEEAGRAVRIMTVHAAKGLQAPIVILPDTVRMPPNKISPLLWPHKSNAPHPIFCPVKDILPRESHAILNAMKEKQKEEYRRLLYVAMTRAENRLYIGGYTNRQKPHDHCWYQAITRMMTEHPNSFEREENALPCRVLTNPALDNFQEEQPTIAQSLSFTAPDWLMASIPQEPSPPRILRPSRPQGSEEEQALSPLKVLKSTKSFQTRFKRGTMTHTLLQFLPDLPLGDREAAARRYISQPAHGLDLSIQDSIVQEIMVILTDPDFAPLFGHGSMAEVPISGFIDSQTLVSGQIDRLFITDDEILIVDYKSNRPSPDHAKDIPLLYRQQMQSYRTILSKIYPERRIKTALLWTDTAKLMMVD